VRATRLLKEPLVHFLLAGSALFVAFAYIAKENRNDASRRIVVESDRLLTFLQYNSRTLTPDGLEAGLDDLSVEELERLIDDFVREEALYRQARAVGLDTNDYALRQRIVRRLESINRMVVSSDIQLSEGDLEDYLAAHRDRYFVPPSITFTHVFFSVDRHGDDGADTLAHAKLEELNKARIPFHGAPSHGDRFLYHHNYVNRAADEVASHFGSAMQRELFAREANDTQWIGPFRSPYGYHLVMVTAKTDGYTPSLDEVRRRVEADAFQARVQAELDRITGSIVDGYEVELDEPLRTRVDVAERPK
jgi:hypothetical protein